MELLSKYNFFEIFGYLTQEELIRIQLVCRELYDMIRIYIDETSFYCLDNRQKFFDVLRYDYYISFFKSKLDINDWGFGFELACSWGKIIFVKMIIAKGIKHIAGGLVKACHDNYTDVIKYIIRYCDINDINEGLLTACSNNHIDLIDFLVNNGANNFNECLEEACINPNINIAKLMIEYGATSKDYCLNFCMDEINDSNNSDQDIDEYRKIIKMLNENGAKDLDGEFLNACNDADFQKVEYMLLNSDRFKFCLNLGLSFACINSQEARVDPEDVIKYRKIMNIVIKYGATYCRNKYCGGTILQHRTISI